MAKLNCLSLEKTFLLCPANTRRGPVHVTSITWSYRDSNPEPQGEFRGCKRGKLQVVAATEGSAKSKAEEKRIPSWARPDSDDPPPWARSEGTTKNDFQIPFYVYLLSSAIVAIAAVGSVFEYVNQNPIFGVVSPDSIFYAPLLGFFAFTGLPTAVFLWFKSIKAANKAAEEQDRQDGY